jgi:hypothetical protein
MPAIEERSRLGQAAERLGQLLAQVPNVEVRDLRSKTRGQATDLVADVRTPAGARCLVVEVRAELTPRTLRVAAQALKARLADRPDAIGIIVVPYLSELSREVCRQVGVGCVDLVGNARLAFDQVLIESSGKPNPRPLRRLQRSLFSPRASRMLRVLLEEPSRLWYVRSLAQEAGISLGQASNVKRLLTEQDYLSTEGRAFRLARPEVLLREWAQAYRFQANETRSFYAMLSVPETEQRLADECTRLGIRYGLALFSGAERVAPFTAYTRASAYLDGRVEEIAEAIGLKTVDSGANVSLLLPYDDGVFLGLREIGGTSVVSDVQLYLDLKSNKGRGEEAADFLYERRIQARWDQGPDQTTPPAR